MYADDTTLFCNFDNISNENTINNEINKVYDWLCSNKLSLNVSKTKYMCFHTPNKTVTYPELKINNVTIDRVNFFCEKDFIEKSAKKTTTIYIIYK